MNDEVIQEVHPKFIIGELHDYCQYCKQWIPQSNPIHTCYFADGEPADDKIHKDF